MTGKSKWSDEIQKKVVRDILNGYDSYSALATEIPSGTHPSDKTVKRWYDKWATILMKEDMDRIKEEADRQDRQNKTERRHHKPIIPRDRQNEYIPIPMKFLSVVEDMAYNWLSSYKSYNNAATVRKRAIVTRIAEITKKEVDKK